MYSHLRHVEHHTFTSTFDENTGYADPQQKEDFWCQDAQLLDFWESKGWTAVVLQLQAYCGWMPLVVGSRTAISLASFLNETRRKEFLGFGLHLAWTALLLSPLALRFSVGYMFRIYFCAHLWFSILAFQLQSNPMFFLTPS